MLILLPPSETKHPGGDGPPLRLDRLALPSLGAQREAALDALVALSSDPPEAMRVLKLSEKRRGEVETNAALRSAPTMPAADRYTGVLYDALGAATLPAAARRWLGAHALIHTAVLGPVGALDPIPAYRLAAGTSLPGIPPLRRHWAAAVTDALRGSRFVVDLRSEAYAALGPVPGDVPSVYVRVVAEGEDGSVRALNHFNKQAKGRFARRLAAERPRAATPSGLLTWAERAGIRLRPGSAEGEVELVAAD